MDGTFLHSPLLDELKSLETMLLRKAYRQRRAALKRDDDGSTGSRVGVEEALAKKPSCRVELPNQVCILVCLPVSSIFPFTEQRTRPYLCQDGSTGGCWALKEAL